MNTDRGEYLFLNHPEGGSEIVDIEPNSKPELDRLARDTAEFLHGNAATYEDEEHIKFLLKAALKFHERDATHKGLWRHFGAIDSAFQCRSKATRLYNNAITLLKAGKLPDNDPYDDALDLINYSVFYIRNVSDERFG